MTDTGSPPGSNDLDPNNGTLQEMLDEPEPEDFTEDDPLILDPSPSPLPLPPLPPNLPPTNPSPSPRPAPPAHPPRNLLPRLLASQHLQTGLRHPRAPLPLPQPLLAIRRPATASVDGAF